MVITHNKTVRLTAKRKALLAVAEYYAKYLKIDNYDVTVCIVFKHLLTETFSVYAQVHHVATNRINIEFDADLKGEMAMQKLAHEFVHVKQYIKGQLSENDKGHQLWKNNTVEADLPYHLTPWEKEAMQKEVLMVHSYIHARDKK